MKKQRIYDLVKTLLEENVELRDSDKKLIWRVWKELDFICERNFSYGGENKETIHFLAFMEAPSTETIRRCRQKVQELHPELRGSKFVQEKRQEKAEQKSMFVFHENYDL